MPYTFCTHWSPSHLRQRHSSSRVGPWYWGLRAPPGSTERPGAGRSPGSGPRGSSWSPTSPSGASSPSVSSAILKIWGIKGMSSGRRSRPISRLRCQLRESKAGRNPSFSRTAKVKAQWAHFGPKRSHGMWLGLPMANQDSKSMRKIHTGLNFLWPLGSLCSESDFWALKPLVQGLLKFLARLCQPVSPHEKCRYPMEVATGNHLLNSTYVN